jgi:hypothetical protein
MMRDESYMEIRVLRDPGTLFDAELKEKEPFHCNSNKGESG